MRLWRYAVITHLGAALKADVLNSDLNKHKLQTPPPMRDIRCGSSISLYRQNRIEVTFLRYAARMYVVPQLLAGDS